MESVETIPQPHGRRTARERRQAVMEALRRTHQQTTIKPDIPARVRGQVVNR
jgi:hypothetical protein